MSSISKRPHVTNDTVSLVQLYPEILWKIITAVCKNDTNSSAAIRAMGLFFTCKTIVQKIRSYLPRLHLTLYNLHDIHCYFAHPKEIRAVSKAVAVLITPPFPYCDVKVNLDGCNFTRKFYYIFFYTKKEMKKTLLDIFPTETATDTDYFETLWDADIWIDAPILRHGKRATIRIPLFYSYTVPGNVYLHKRTDNWSGEIHGIAAHFAYGRVLIEQKPTIFLGHTQILSSLFSNRP